VNGSGELALGVIAAATAIMALVQIGALIMLARVTTQIRDIASTIQQDLRPLIARANAIADEAHKTATLATAQAQKIDRLVTDLTQRVDETSAVIQEAILTPAREGMAIIAGLKAAIGALRGLRDLRSRHARVEDEDALFIG
jgi:replicative DNA helicase